MKLKFSNKISYEVSRIFIFCVLLLVFACNKGFENTSSSKRHPFTASNWIIENTDGTNEDLRTIYYKDKSGIKLKIGQVAYLKDLKFKNFETEFYFNGSFPGISFRVKDDKNYEFLYMRVPMSGKHDALQYIPVFNGSMPWQLYNYPKYEGAATFPMDKLVDLPISMEKEIASGSVSKTLQDSLINWGINISEKSMIFPGDETTSYLYNPEDTTVILINKSEKIIEFLDNNKWIRAKISVLGNKMSVFVEDMENPVFVTENLKGEEINGVIGLRSDFGSIKYGDFSIRELITATESDSNISETGNMEGFITQWKVSKPFYKDSINFVTQIDSLLQYEDVFEIISSDEDGLINISRYYEDMTKTVALTSNILSDENKTLNLKFDYANYLVIMLDSSILFNQSMNFTPPPGKGREGRVIVGDESIPLPLKKGRNKLIFVLSGDKLQGHNWGFVAKLENTHGVSME